MRNDPPRFGPSVLAKLEAIGKTPEELEAAIDEYAEESGLSRASASKTVQRRWFEGMKGRSKKEPMPPVPSVKMERFGGRTATMAEIVEFVAGHVLVEDVTPEMCPDPRAYTYWWYCRNDESWAKDFLKATAVKQMPSKVNPENPLGVNDFDGKVQSGLVDDLLRAKAKSERFIAG
jgi:hypothetical protein